MSPADEFEELIRQCQAELFAVLLARCAARELAKDLLQDVLLKAWRHREKLLSMAVDQRRRYLFAMAKNRAIDHTRQLQKEGEVSQPLLPEGRLGAATPASPDERLEYMDRCIQRLAIDDRELLLLSIVGGLDGETIANRVGSIPSTVRSRLSRIRRQLRECITESMERGKLC